MTDIYIKTDKGGSQSIVISSLVKVGLNSYHRPIYKRTIILEYPIPSGVDGLEALTLAKREGIL